MGGGIAPTSETKTVVVLGVAYGGTHAAQTLAAGLPEGWRLILIDRNSHANHVYVMPRYAVLPGHEYKAFIPYTNVFRNDNKNPNYIVLKAQVVSLRPNHVTLSQAFPEKGIPTNTIAFDYAIYALGAHLPSPLDLWNTDPRSESLSDPKSDEEWKWTYDGFKTEGCQWFQERQKLIERAPSVLVVGGGALGIQFATDIKAIHPEKKVTLLHSRQRLLPRFDQGMHDEIRKAMDVQEIELILGERLDLSTVDTALRAGKDVNAQGQRIVRTVTGREIAADLLLLCVGQTPNSGILAAMDPSTVDPSTKLAHVRRTMQLSTTPVPWETETDSALAAEAEGKLNVSESPESSAPSKTTASDLQYPHIFAVGDVANAFGAIPAGHNAYYQGKVAADNILKLIKRRESAEAGETVEEPLVLDEYTPGPPAIKISLGLTKGVYQVGSEVGVKNDGVPDLQAGLIWPLYGIKVETDEDMKA